MSLNSSTCVYHISSKNLNFHTSEHSKSFPRCLNSPIPKRFNIITNTHIGFFLGVRFWSCEMITYIFTCGITVTQFFDQYLSSNHETCSNWKYNYFLESCMLWIGWYVECSLNQGGATLECFKVGLRLGIVRSTPNLILQKQQIYPKYQYIS